MGRDAVITFEQVAAVADAMKTAGAKPTSRLVRERLGNVGSMGTINKLLQQWKAAQERPMGQALVLPAPLQRAILDFMAEELAAARAALEADLVEQQQEAADLATDNERQAAELVGHAQSLVAVQAELASVQGRLAHLESDLAVERETVQRERAAAEAARIELAKAQLQLGAVPRLETDVAGLRSVLDEERQLRVVAERQGAVVAAQLEAAAARAVKAEAEAAEARTQAAAAVSKAVAAESSLANLTGRVASLQAQIDERGTALEAARQEARKAGEAAAELRGKHGRGRE